MKISSNLYETCSRIWHFTFFRLVIDCRKSGGSVCCQPFVMAKAEAEQLFVVLVERGGFSQKSLAGYLLAMRL
jgi:hypothetical protein